MALIDERGAICASACALGVMTAKRKPAWRAAGPRDDRFSLLLWHQ